MPRANLARFLDLEPASVAFRDAVLAGLARSPRSIPCRFLYDAQGSALFEQICELPEYYVTRTELAILRAHAPAMARLIGPACQLIELGSGASRKVRLLLDALERPAVYAPVDISREFLREAASRVAADFPELAVIAICADYSDPRMVGGLPPPAGGRRVGFFPGSTIGNLEPAEAVAFLRGCRAILGSRGGMLVGVDLKKDPEVLHRAYNDAAGVTAAFTLNLLARVKRELGAELDVARFRHDAFYNPAPGRIEIYARSLADQLVTVAGRTFAIAAGERLHVESSYKYTVPEFQALGQRAGFRPVAVWTDPAELFSVHYLEA
jgi:dimethylhistidine N-methyltransferase